jgi:hypothetical protein
MTREFDVAAGESKPRKTRGDMDLTQIDGKPTAGAEQAFTRTKSGIKLTVRNKVFGTVTGVIDVTGNSLLHTVVGLGAAAVPAGAVMLALRYVGLDATVDAIAGGVVYLVTVGGSLLHHRRKQ